jgi:microsomal epoxide hydrolase
MPDQPFTIAFDQAARNDLHRRLDATIWSDAVTDDWSYGTSRPFLQHLLQHWRHDYHFDAAEQRLNAMPQYRADIDGFAVHYRRMPGRGTTPKPLLLINGWPSSFVEYERLAPMLADPAAFGGSSEDAFDVIMPALPGFGFSDRPTRPDQVHAENLFHTLMTRHLGHDRFLASGTDIGAGVARRLASKYPDAVRGIHVSAVPDPELTPSARPLTEAERAYQAQSARWSAEEGAYEHLHYTRPQTLAFALADSPAGLASWIVEKFWSWSDHGPDLFQTFPPDMLIDNLMIYWITGTIGASMRTYYEHAHFRPSDTSRLEVPTAICTWPNDLVVPPREWAERSCNVRQYTSQRSGGHFPAWEVPEAYAADLRRFARSLEA